MRLGVPLVVRWDDKIDPHSRSACMSQTWKERVRWTTADLELLPDNGNRYEIIDGELFVTRAPLL